MSSLTGFNPSVGILGVQAPHRHSSRQPQNEFQSLGRDSGCSSLADRMVAYHVAVVSIPRSGFWVFKHGQDSHGPQGRAGFQSLGRDSGCSSLHRRDGLAAAADVSIPRSGFWVFKRDPPATRPTPGLRFNPSVGILGVQAWPVTAAARRPSSFNPSVGILGVQASATRQERGHRSRFQSLSRDSGCSSFSFMSRQ